MENIFCKSCGGIVERQGDYCVCKYCGNKWIVDVAHDVNAVQRANAWEALRVNDFEKSTELFEEIILKDKTNHEAYWGRALAQNGIIYVTDYDAVKKVPTLNNISEESFLDNEDVKKAISNAPETIKKSYQKQAEAIEKIRIEWINKASKEPPYDIFISFKDSDREHGVERTQDSVDVQDLYTALVSKGYNVFYSRVTLRDKVSEQYEPYIYNAIKTAKVMIVFGEKPEYFNAVWVKNEWSRFKKRIEKGEKHKNSLITVYKNVNPYDIPTALTGGRQALDYSIPSNFEILMNHVKRIIEETKKVPTLEKIEIKGGQIAKKSSTIQTETIKTREIGGGAVAETDIDTRQKLDLVYTYVTKKMWDRAKDLIDDVLFDNPQNAEALFLDLYTKYEIDFNYKSCKNIYESLFVNLRKVRKEDLKQIEYILSIATVEFAEKLLNAMYSIRANIDNDNYLTIFRALIPYDFNGRKEKIKELFAVAIKQSNFKLFSILLSSLESTDVDEYIDYNLKFFNNTEDEVAERVCIDNVLSVQEGNVEALKGLIIINFKASDNKKVINTFEKLLKYSKDTKEEVRWFLENFGVYGTVQKKQCALISQILRYYPGEFAELYNELLLVSDTMLESKCFDECIELCNLMVGLDKLNSNLCYWKICLCKLKVCETEAIVDSDIPIADLPEFTKYLTLVNEDERIKALDLSVEQEKIITKRQKSKQEERERAELAKINKQKQEQEERRRQVAIENEKKQHTKSVARRVILWALIVVFVVGCFAKCSGCDSCNQESGYLKMELSNDGSYYIVQDTWLDSKDEYVIPEYYKGLPVKEIANNAFDDQTRLKSVTIPSTIEKIGSRAFWNCTSLNVVNYNAENCQNLDDEGEPFYNAGAEGNFTLNIGPTVKKIPNYLFYAYAGTYDTRVKLTTINFSEGCEVIGEMAFQGCEDLRIVNFPNSLKKISYGAFASSGLKEVVISDGVEQIEKSAFYCSDLVKVDIGNGVKEIGEYAFNNCEIEEIRLGSSLTKVHEWAFHHNNNVKKVYYRGTKESYKKITIENYNGCLENESIRSYI